MRSVVCAHVTSRCTASWQCRPSLLVCALLGSGLCPQIDCLAVCFRLEMLEVSGCSVLSCNVAWHAQAAHTNSQYGSWQAHDADDCDSSRGFSSVQDAVAHAVAALDGAKAPAVPAAPALQVHYLSQTYSRKQPFACCRTKAKMQVQAHIWL